MGRIGGAHAVAIMMENSWEIAKPDGNHTNALRRGLGDHHKDHAISIGSNQSGRKRTLATTNVKTQNGSQRRSNDSLGRGTDGLITER